MTEACVHMKCYSLKRVPSEWNTRMKAQRINDNHLSNDREATSRLPALALILPARTTAAHMKHKRTLTRSSLALDLVADVCRSIMLNPGFHYPQGRVIRDEPPYVLSYSQEERKWIGVGKGGWALEIMPCEFAHLPAGHHLNDGVMHTV